MTPQDVLKLCEQHKVEFVDLLRKVSQAVQRPALEAQGQGQGGPGAIGGGGAGGGPRLVATPRG